MKKIIALIGILTLCACITETPQGKCVGINEKQDFNLEYKVEIWNIFWSITFARAIFPPILMLWKCTYCPVAYKQIENKDAN